MSVTTRRFDWTILVCALLLSGFGVAIIGSVAPALLASQIIFYLLGFIFFYLFSRIDYRIYESVWKQMYGLSLILLLVTLVLGLEARGATRWISVFGLRLQFSEILKPFLIASIASFFAQKRELGPRQIILGLGIMSLPVLLVFKQPDLGNALLYLASFSALTFVAGTNFSYIVISLLGTGILLPVAWHFLADYQKLRLWSFISPMADPLGASYNAIQAVIAVGSGMFWGRGLGRGPQSQLLFLPEHHTDFVFASISEELGFVGAGLVLLIYFVLIWRIFRIGERASDKLGQVLAPGLAMMLLAQVFINIGMNMAILPVTGITLPLISYGGSSIMATFISLGIIANIASRRAFK